MPRILHVLAQRPSRTGSGVTLDALVRQGSGRWPPDSPLSGGPAENWSQAAVVGTPASDPQPAVGTLDEARVFPLVFGRDEPLDFPLPGMSDVMPYPATRYRDLTAKQLDRYRDAWRAHLASAIAQFEPDLVHAHHVWLVASWVKDVAPELPLLIHCHATGLRQAVSCPELAKEVIAGCRRADGFCALHRGHAAQLQTLLGVERDRIDVVGAGYRDDIFFAAPERKQAGELLFVGKRSRAKGLPWLLEAFERLCACQRGHDWHLHIVGGGVGAESEMLERRIAQMPAVTMHGIVSEAQLVELMQRSAVCVLPSLYEGVPLVLAEAFACGCRIVATALPGIVDQLAPVFGDALSLVPLPRIEGADEPLEADLPAFVADLQEALSQALAKPALEPDALGAASPLSWGAVFERIATRWKEMIESRPRNPKPSLVD
jgi:glycosyltransferase involved in cell wall biosynthesis